MCYIYVSPSEFSIYEISENLGPKNFTTPQNFRKLRTKKKSLRFSLIFILYCLPWRKGTWLVPIFGFGVKFCQTSSKQNCRRVRTLALEAIGLGLGSRLQRRARWRTCIRRLCHWLVMSLAGNGWLGLWLASYVADWLSGWLVLLAVWLYGCVAGWLACYGCLCSWLAMWLAGFAARWLWLACPPATWLADNWLGCWLPTWLVVKLLAG